MEAVTRKKFKRKSRKRKSKKRVWQTRTKTVRGAGKPT